MKRSGIKRGKPLERKAKLEAKTEGLKRSPLKRSAFIAKPTKEDPRLTASRPIVYARSGGRCELVEEERRCEAVATDVHHILRRRDSDHSPEQLVHLCRPHHSKSHLDKTWAHAVGTWKHFWQ